MCTSVQLVMLQGIIDLAYNLKAQANLENSQIIETAPHPPPLASSSPQSVVNVPVNISEEKDDDLRSVLSQLEYGNKISILRYCSLLPAPCSLLPAPCSLLRSSPQRRLSASQRLCESGISQVLHLLLPLLLLQCTEVARFKTGMPV